MKRVLIVAIAALACGFIMAAALSTAGVIASVVQPSPAIVVSEQAVVTALQQDAQIVGLAGQVRKSAQLDDSNFWGDRKLSATLRGYYKLGVNAANLGVAVDGSTVTITLPPTELIAADFPFDELTLDAAVGLLRGEITEQEKRDLYKQARLEAIGEVLADAELAKRTQANVRLIIERLLSAVPNVERVIFTEEAVD